MDTAVNRLVPLRGPCGVSVAAGRRRLACLLEPIRSAVVVGGDPRLHLIRGRLARVRGLGGAARGRAARRSGKETAVDPIQRRPARARGSAGPAALVSQRCQRIGSYDPGIGSLSHDKT